VRLPHHPAVLAALRRPTPDEPLRVLLSGCLAGWACGVEGTDYGLGAVLSWRDLPTVTWVPFCPEDVGLGTPRTMPDLHGGDGHGVLAGTARVVDEHGTDLTEGMVRGARAMLAHALAHRVELAVLTDMSAACGSQVISSGCRFHEPRRFQQGVGVATALLLQAGVPVVSQRDHQTLGLLRAQWDPDYTADPEALDHHRHPWTRGHFEAGSG
jgi:uncharacterized protein YbbK (DUF523 family)